MRVETERLFLREFGDEDFEAFSSLMAAPEVMHFSLTGPMSEELARAYFQKRIVDHYDKFGYGLFALFHKADNNLIGAVGLINQNVDGEDKVELGYRLLPKYWGKGLATEACLAVCKYAFAQLGMRELISIIDPKNTRSLEVAKRVGLKFVKEACFHGIPVQIYRIRAFNGGLNIIVRNLLAEDIQQIAKTFIPPWGCFEDTFKLWNRWLEEQQNGTRTVCVLERDGCFFGYGSLLRASEYAFFKEHNIPEVNAIWIKESFRRLGLGKMLVEHLENIARLEGYKAIGLGVGLYRDYGPAQKLYFKMGYQPDGNGITYRRACVVPGNSYHVDDDLLLWLSKPLVA